jgi:hypothetical protein
METVYRFFLAKKTRYLLVYACDKNDYYASYFNISKDNNQ